MIRAILVDKNSPILGEECALCKHPFGPADEALVCPEDGARHHVHCWRANGESCTNYGCAGSGPVITTDVEQLVDQEEILDQTVADYVAVGRQGRRSKVHVLPSSSLGCAQSCLLLSIAIAIVLMAVGCFGLWSIADYILIEVLDWQYRAPISGFIPGLHLLLQAAAAL